MPIPADYRDSPRVYLGSPYRAVLRADVGIRSNSPRLFIDITWRNLWFMAFLFCIHLFQKRLLRSLVFEIQTNGSSVTNTIVFVTEEQFVVLDDMMEKVFGLNS